MEKQYPDFVHHVGKGYQDGRENMPWCGSSEKPFFLDASHAALNGDHKGRLVACPECVKKIHEALTNGHDELELE